MISFSSSSRSLLSCSPFCFLFFLSSYLPSPPSGFLYYFFSFQLHSDFEFLLLHLLLSLFLPFLLLFQASNDSPLIFVSLILHYRLLMLLLLPPMLPQDLLLFLFASSPFLVLLCLILFLLFSSLLQALHLLRSESPFSLLLLLLNAAPSLTFLPLSNTNSTDLQNRLVH